MRARSPRRRPLRPSNATASPPQSCAADGGAPWETRRPPPRVDIPIAGSLLSIAMSEIAQAIANRQSEIDRLQAEIASITYWALAMGDSPSSFRNALCFAVDS